MTNNNLLFTPGKIGTLELKNRLVRSATAERMSDDEGRPGEKFKELYKELTRGGVGLIITGHMYIHPSGKAHEEMTGIYSDDLIPGLTELTDVVHKEGGKVVVQINHGGMQCAKEAVSEPIAPSARPGNDSSNPAREMTTEEIHMVIDAFGQAARRAKEAGFDGVQIHGAHGYLTSQFLSPHINKRADEWDGDINDRMRFLKEVSKAVREEVGPDYPVLIKLGVMDGVEDGLTLEEGLEVLQALKGMGIDGVEISGGIGGKKLSTIGKGIRREEEEAYFREFAQKARPVTDLPILLVGGFRSKSVMEDVLESGDADFISICRPLINNPQLPNEFKEGIIEKSGCISSNNCWPVEKGVGIGCKCPIDKLEK